MDTSQAEKTVIHEAGGTYTDADLEVFHRWAKEHPEYTWTRAEVDRYDGLTLFHDNPDGTVVGLHFATMLCGYGGTGPSTTLIVLEEAGFGEVNVLRKQIFTEMHVRLSK